MGSAYRAIKEKKEESAGYDVNNVKADIRGHAYRSSYEKEAIERRKQAFVKWKGETG